MEGVDEKVREANAIIYDDVLRRYICPLCNNPLKDLLATHLNKDSHKERLQVFKTFFLIVEKQPFCKLCNRKLEWQEVREHANFHKIIPYWDPPDKHLTFFANYVSSVSKLYYCHLCDKVLKNWVTALRHLCEEHHSDLLKKVGKHKFAKKWEIHCKSWLVHQLTPGPENQIECQVCKVTMNSGKAESHIKLSGHTLNKRAHRAHVRERVRREVLEKSCKPQEQTLESTEQITPKFSERQMICNFSIEPDSAMSNRILESEQKKSSDESEPNNLLCPKSAETKGESSLHLKNSHVDDSNRVDFEFLVTDSSWVLATSNPLFIQLSSERGHKKLNLATVTKPFYCLLCFKNLANAETAKVHRTRKTHKRSLKTYGSDYVSRKNAKYYCVCCDKETGSLLDLYRHITTHSRHLQIVSELNLQTEDLDQPENNKSSGIRTNDNTNFETCSKNLDPLSTSSSLVCGAALPLSCENLTLTCDKPKSQCEDSQDFVAPKDRMYENCSTSSESAPKPEVFQAAVQEVDNLERFQKDLDWVIEISNPLYTLVPEHLRKYRCLICFEQFSGVENVKNHVTCENHELSTKKYGCDAIVIAESGDYYCTCCKQKEQKLYQIYSHLLSDEHAHQLSKRNKQNNGQSVALPAEKKSSEMKTIDNVVAQPLCEDVKKRSMSSLSLCEKRKRSRDNSRDSIESKDRLDLNLSSVKPESSLRKNNSGAAKRRRRELANLDRDLNWLIRTSNPSCKQILPTKVRKQLPDNADEELVYCLICLDHHFGVRAAKRHISGEQHGSSMKKYGCDCIVISETGNYHCTCCDRTKEYFGQIYDHIKSDRHVKQYLEYNKRNDGQSVIVESRKTSSESSSNDTDVSQQINIDLDPSLAKLSSSCDNVAVSDKKALSPCRKLTFSEQPKPLFGNLPETSESKDHSSFSTIIPGPSLEPKMCSGVMKKRRNFEFFAEDSNWIISKSHPLFYRLAPRNFHEKFVAEGEQPSFYCTVCDDAFSSIESATEHESSEHHVHSMIKYGCDRIIKTENKEYYCTCCFQQKTTAKEICQHVMSDGHVERVRICNQQKDVQSVPIRGENGSSEMIKNDNGDWHSFSQDLKPTLSNLPASSHLLTKSSNESARLTEKSMSFCPKPTSSCENLGKIAEDILSSNFSTIDTEPSSATKPSIEEKWVRENSKYVKNDLNWIIETSNALYEKIVPKNVRTLLADHTKGDLLYCLICMEYFIGAKVAEQHIAEQGHVIAVKKYGCDLIVKSEAGNYHCTCCERQIKTLEHVYHHPLTNGHAKRFRYYNQRNSSHSTSVNAQKESKVLKTIDGGVPLCTKAIEQLSSSSSTSFDESTPFGEDSKSSCEKLTSFDDKSEERSERKDELSANLSNISSGRSSVSNIIHQDEKKEMKRELLKSGLNGVIRVSNPVYKRVVPNNQRWVSCDNRMNQLFCCLVCCEHLFGIEAVNMHISLAGHENSMKKYGCYDIVETETGGYFCPHCDREKSLEGIYNHLISEGHAKQLSVNNSKKGGESVITETINKSSDMKTIDSVDWQKCSKDRHSFSTNSQSSRDTSCDNREPNLGLENKRSEIENSEFRDSDLNWMVGLTHPLFKLDKTSVAKLLAKDSKKSYCLICCCYYSRIQSAKEHIASPSHNICLKVHGCHYIGVTPDSKYFCTCCDRKDASFTQIYSHVISERHLKKVRGMVEQEMIEKNEPNVEESKGSSSPKVPEIQDSFNLKVSPGVQGVIKNREFRETDLNWVVSGTHKLCKSLQRTQKKQMIINASGESFVCLICWPIYGDFVSFSEAEKHISSESHAHSVQKYGCGYIELTPKFRYRCTCCNRQKGSFLKIFSHIQSDGHRENLWRLQQERNVKAMVVDGENKSSEVRRISNSIVKQEISESLDPFSTSLALIEKKVDSQEPMDVESCQTVEEPLEKLDFFARDLDWVIDSHHKLFAQRKVKKFDETLSSSKKVQLYHCLVCFEDFPNAMMTKNHIFGEEHRNSMRQYGCHSIEVTATLNYRCTVCDHETKTFPKILEHIMSDKHINLHRSTVLREEEKKPLEVKYDIDKVVPQFWETAQCSFNWADDYESETQSYEKPQSSRNDTPDSSESNDWFHQNFPKLNSASREQQVVEKPRDNFKFIDEDLNWVVGSSHKLYIRKRSGNGCAKPGGNMGEQSFYCLVCFDNLSGVESAILHISGKQHEESMKQFGCNFIEVTRDSRYKCTCCYRIKKRFAFMYMHLRSGSHMNRVCEINKETDAPSGVKFVSEESNDLKNQDNEVGQSFSQHSEPFTEKPIALKEDETSFCEASSSMHESASCIFVTKRNARKSYCHICESMELPIATKNLDGHIDSLRHKFSLKRYGCDKIETRKNGSYYCVCCDSQFSNLQNVYLHVKDKKHMSSLVKVEQESKRVKKVSRTISPVNRCRAIGKPLLSEFVVKKINDPDDMANVDFHEPVDEFSNNILPKYSANSKNPLLNSLPITMVKDLSRLSNQIGKTEESKFPDENSSSGMKQQAVKNRFISRERIRCKICKLTVSSRTDFHSHMAKHISEEIVSMENAKPRDDNETKGQKDSTELMDLENFETITEVEDLQSEELSNGSSDRGSCLTLSESAESPKFDRWLSRFDESSLSGSDIQLGNNLSDHDDDIPEWDREQYMKNVIETSKSLKKMNLKVVLSHLKFKHNYIFELDDKLKDLQRGLQMSLIIDEKTIYCLVCRVRVTNTMKDYYNHLWSLDHCNYLDVMENDATEYANFPSQFSDLDLAHEFMEEISDDKVRCYLCKKDVENEDESLRDHIHEDKHESACALTRSNASKLFETMKNSLKCDWYSIERYSCFACSVKTKSELGFFKHLKSAKHSQKMLEWPNFERKMLLDCCLSCAVLWYGYRSSHFYHANEVATHNWLSNDGFYLARDLRKNAKTLLQQPENHADRTIRHLDEIRAEQTSKEVAVVDDLQKIVRLTFPRAKAYSFGSRVTGLNSEDSDIDIFLDCRNAYDGKQNSLSITRFIDSVHKCLSKNPECWDVHEVLTNCRSPIVRAYHRPTGLFCDISFNNGLVVEKTKFIKRIVDVYPKFRKLVIILKTWMAYCDLTGSERIAHNSLYWLVIFYLQNEKILPSIATLISLKNKSKMIAGCQAGVSHDFECWEPDGDSSVKELLRRFFTFYANFDFRLKVACPLLGEAIKKRDFAVPKKLPKEMKTYVEYVRKSKDGEMFRIDSPMCIQDPFDLPHNITKAVRKHVLNRFRTCCLKSLDFMASL